MYDLIKDDGVYLCEDTHTSYMTDGFSGGYKQSNTFIEQTKNFVDSLHAHWFDSNDEQKKFRNTTDSVHYYDSVVVLEKKVSERPAPCVSVGSRSASLPL